MHYINKILSTLTLSLCMFAFASAQMITSVISDKNLRCSISLAQDTHGFATFNGTDMGKQSSFEIAQGSIIDQEDWFAGVNQQFKIDCGQNGWALITSTADLIEAEKDPHQDPPEYSYYTRYINKAERKQGISVDGASFETSDTYHFFQPQPHYASWHISKS